MADALTASEREDIHTLLVENPRVSWAEIGRNLDRHPTTIAREVARNGGRTAYRSTKAQQRCDQQRRRPRPRQLEPGAHTVNESSKNSDWAGHLGRSALT